MKRTAWFAAIWITFALLAGGCLPTFGEQAETRTSIPLVDAIGNDIVLQADPITDDPAKANCVGEEMYETIGLARLAELGVTVNEPSVSNLAFTPAEDEVIDEIMLDCLGAVVVAANQIKADAAAAVPAGSEPTLVEAIVADLLAEDPTVDPAGARCFAEVTYDVIGPQRLDEAGVTVEFPDPWDSTLTRDEAEIVIDGYLECIDIKKALIDVFTSPPDPLTVAEANCVWLQIDGEDGTRSMLLDDWFGTASAETEAIWRQAGRRCDL